MRRSSELCAIAGLARYYARACENVESVSEEILSLIEHRWGLTADERLWCIEVLTDNYDGNRQPIQLIQHTYGILDVDDYALLAQCLGWFGSEETAMNAMLRDVGSIGLSIPADVDLFPENVCAAFRVLEIEPTLDVNELDKKYREWAKLLHPDSLVGVDLSRAEQTQAGELLRDVSNARDVIKLHLRGLQKPNIR